MRCPNGHHNNRGDGTSGSLACPDCRADWEANGSGPDPYTEAVLDDDKRHRDAELAEWRRSTGRNRARRYRATT